MAEERENERDGLEDLTTRVFRLLRANPAISPERIAASLGLEVGFVQGIVAQLREADGRVVAHPPRPRRVRRALRRASYLLGTALVALGIVLLLGVGGLYAYGAYEQLRFEAELAETPVASLPASPVQAGEASPTPAPGLPATPAGPQSSPTPTPTPVILPPARIIAPKIDLDSRVVESPIEDGQWQVPKFVAGHLEGTANPGEPGNVVLSGHVESISSGNVFANLDGLEEGDEITLLTQVAAFRYLVTEKKVVTNTDVSVVQPTADATLTLITCTGTFQPATRDYDRRLVVVAKQVPFDDASDDRLLGY